MKNLINIDLFKRVYKKITGYEYQVSYSQNGEDLIVDFIISAKKIKNFTYLDIGANDPIKFNNTYKFYEKGYRGVCIEPNPFIFNKLKYKRKYDVCLNIGVGVTQEESQDFFIMDNPFLSTFSQKEAFSLENEKHAKIQKIIRVDLKTTSQIIEQYFQGISPTFINLDVEGIDEEILRAFPFTEYKPSIFCIETVNYTDDATSKKRVEIIEKMTNAGYEIFADTYVNTIFLSNE
jgi:FkbM family methyltransferase